MSHSWCRDITRDEAVRAAEDGRSGPLPTLADVIAEPFADSAKCSPTVSEMGGTQSWLRTDRVTLECVHRFKQHPSVWDWWRLMELRPGESVRVVEEVHFDDLAQVAMERDAAIRERDQGKEFWMGELRSRTAERDAARARVAELEAQVADCNILLGDRWRKAVYAVTGESAPAASGAAGTEVASAEPLAWGVMSSADPPHRVWLHWEQELAERWARQKQCDYNAQLTVVPLYAAPQAAKGWLTAEEREAVEWFCGSPKAISTEQCDRWKDALRDLLARSSPPEVVLPVLHTRSEVNEANHKSPCLWFRRPDVIEALAAAGVTVKEVGR
jgi:hypothetical protein